MESTRVDGLSAFGEDVPAQVSNREIFRVCQTSKVWIRKVLTSCWRKATRSRLGWCRALKSPENVA